MDLELSHDQAFAFAAIATMSLVSYADGDQNENELEEIYIQIYQCERLSEQTDFALEALDEVKERLELNYLDAQEAIISDLSSMIFEHDDAVYLMNMAIDVAKSNKAIPSEKIDVLNGLCKVLNLYSDEFNFAT